MGSVIFDESSRPVCRMTYQGECDDEQWRAHIDTMSSWARSGEPYGVVIDAQQVGRVSPIQRKAIVDWINRDRQHLKSNCAGGALIFASPMQQGLWTAIVWVTPIPIPVKVFRDVQSAEGWLRAQLRDKAAP
ncbi:MAG: hypothetical protein WBG86_12405 [Polyangiales bacterium]